MQAAEQPAGNYYDKYGTRNPIARRLMRGFTDAFDRLAAAVPPGPALEVGCGEGELSIRMAKAGREVRACDIDEGIILEAQKRSREVGADIEFWSEGIYSLEDRHAATLVVCCEVIEHLDDPQRGLDVLARLAQPYLLASVPREPIWRAMNMARGKYLGNLGNTPGHVNHFGRRGFLEFLSRRFTVEEVASPLPWTMALCRVR